MSVFVKVILGLTIIFANLYILGIAGIFALNTLFNLGILYSTTTILAGGILAKLIDGSFFKLKLFEIKVGK